MISAELLVTGCTRGAPRSSNLSSVALSRGSIREIMFADAVEVEKGGRNRRKLERDETARSNDGRLFRQLLLHNLQWALRQCVLRVGAASYIALPERKYG